MTSATPSTCTEWHSFFFSLPKDDLLGHFGFGAAGTQVIGVTNDVDAKLPLLVGKKDDPDKAAERGVLNNPLCVFFKMLI